MKLNLSLLAATTLVTTGCQQPAAPANASAAAPLTQAEAEKIADATVVELRSMDGARIKGIYDPAVVGFDTSYGPLVTDRATWDKNEEGFIAGKFDKVFARIRKVQPLGADVVVMSGTWDLTSTAMPKNAMTVRCTDVYHRDAAGKWPIVNEHCSLVPKLA